MGRVSEGLPPEERGGRTASEDIISHNVEHIAMFLVIRGSNQNRITGSPSDR